MSAEDIDLALVNDALTERVLCETTSVQTEWTGRVTSKDLEGVYYVDITGGATAMPCVRSLVDVHIGQIVDVRIQNGHAVITGCRSDPVATSSTVNVVEKKVTTIRNEVQIIRTEKADVTELNAVRANVEELHAQYGEFQTVVTQDLLAANADIINLKAKDVTIEGNLSAATGRIGTLETNTADIGTIRANSAKVKDVTAQQITAATGYISDLTAGNVTAANIISDHGIIGNLDANYAQIDMANVSNAWITNGTIKDGAISSAMINTLSANKIVGGTADFSKMNVVNLKAENIEVDKINGQTVTGKTVVDALTQHESDISDLDSKLDDAVDDLQDQIDGAIETWTGTEVPTLLNTPASAWTTDDDRRKHVGDVYFVVNSQSQQNGYNYRFTKTGNEYSWQLIKDSDVTNALQRLTTAEGKITTFDSDISTLKTDTGEIKTRTTSLETRMSDAEDDILDRVDTTTFNELSSTVDENSGTITTLSTVLSNNGLTTATNISNTVNSVSQTAASNSSKISQLTTTLGTNADGTSAANDVVHRVSDVEQDLDGITSRVSKTEAHIAGDFALSTTNAGTTAKVATITPSVTGWVLEKGVSVTVRFDKENTVASPTLNVNSTGAKAIRDYAGNALAESAYKWKAGTVYSFTYDGTYWRLQDSLLTSRVTQAESTITQHATDIEAKVSKDGVIAAINLSTETEGGSTAKISADKVNIEGAAIFTSGRLSQSSLNSAYDAAGSASAAQAAAISAAATDATSKANAAEQNAKAAIPTDISDLNNDAGYQTASQVSTAVTNGTANLAAKSDAVARTQRIYYRQTASGSAPGANTTWLSTSGTGYGNWSLSIPQLTNGETKYPKLYMATQTQTVAQQAAGSTCTCTTPALDDSTTIIDGGTIITGSVTANQLSANSVTADKIAANAITVGKMPSADQASILNSNVTISNVNGLQDALDGKETAGAAAAVQTELDGVAQEVQNKADSSSLDSTNDDLAQLVAGLSTSDHFNVNDDGSYTFGLDGALESVETKAAQDLSDSEGILNQKIDANVTALQSKIDEASKANLYMHFDEASDGLEIGKNLDGTAGVFRQLMDDQGTHWQYNREDAAYVGVNDEGKGTMFLDEAQVTGRLRVGNYIFVGNDAGTRMSLKWIGD